MTCLAHAQTPVEADPLLDSHNAAAKHVAASEARGVLRARDQAMLAIIDNRTLKIPSRVPSRWMGKPKAIGLMAGMTSTVRFETLN